MADREPEVFEIAKKIRYDLTGLQAKVTELLNALGRLNLPDEHGDKAFKCRHGCTSFATSERLATHLYNVHGEGELPALSTHEELS